MVSFLKHKSGQVTASSKSSNGFPLSEQKVQTPPHGKQSPLQSVPANLTVPHPNTKTCSPGLPNNPESQNKPCLCSCYSLGLPYPSTPSLCMVGKFLVLSDSSISAPKPSLTLSSSRDHSHLCVGSNFVCAAFTALRLPSVGVCLSVNSLKAETTSYLSPVS